MLIIYICSVIDDKVSPIAVSLNNTVILLFQSTIHTIYIFFCFETCMRKHNLTHYIGDHRHAAQATVYKPQFECPLLTRIWTVHVSHLVYQSPCAVKTQLHGRTEIAYAHHQTSLEFTPVILVNVKVRSHDDAVCKLAAGESLLCLLRVISGHKLHVDLAMQKAQNMSIIL